jgi:hypothetical protein
MSLRLRLNLVYASLLGGAILLFGALVYGLVSQALLQQVDSTLTNASDQLVVRLRVSSTGTFDPRSVVNFSTTENLLFQVWGKDRTLQISRPTTLKLPLDDLGLTAGQTIINYAQLNGLHLRVISTPLQTERGPIGILQVGTDIRLLDVTLTTLATVLVLLAVIAMVLSGLAAWFMTGRALARLPALTILAGASPIPAEPMMKSGS